VFMVVCLFGKCGESLQATLWGFWKDKELTCIQQHYTLLLLRRLPLRCLQRRRQRCHVDAEGRAYRYRLLVYGRCCHEQHSRVFCYLVVGVQYLCAEHRRSDVVCPGLGVFAGRGELCGTDVFTDSVCSRCLLWVSGFCSMRCLYSAYKRMDRRSESLCLSSPRQFTGWLSWITCIPRSMLCLRAVFWHCYGVTVEKC
jgi:hypothetical protein